MFYKFFAVVGVVLILVGVAMFALPRGKESTPTAMRRSAPPPPAGIIGQVLTLAEQYNAPLSILFGAMSLYYSRRRYVAERDRAGRGRA